MQRDPQGKPRILEPQRTQGEFRFEIPDDRLALDHPARLLWEVFGTVDLSGFSLSCGSQESRAGRSLLSPRMLLTLWSYAVSIGIGSAREISRLTRTDAAFRWIVGDLSVSHHKLSGFRANEGAALDVLMTDVLASLVAKNLLSLDLVAQDGTRTRAAASAPSFRREASLLECQEQAALHLKAVLSAADGDDPEYTQTQHARREAAAREFKGRVDAAVATVQQLQQARSSKQKEKEPRASTTDAEARVMKMGDGGFRPAYNVQYAVAGSELGGPRTIVGLVVNNIGNDQGSLAPMVEQIEQRTGQQPKTLMADGGYESHADIIRTRAMGVDVLVPPSERAKPIEQLSAEDADPELIAWRQRMESPEAKKTYRARPGLCELANAHQKTHRGLRQFLVRGVAKATNVVLLGAISTNILQHAKNLLA